MEVSLCLPRRRVAGQGKGKRMDMAEHAGQSRCQVITAVKLDRIPVGDNALSPPIFVGLVNYVTQVHLRVYGRPAALSS